MSSVRKIRKGYHLNVRMHLNPFKITVTCLRITEGEYDPDENKVPRRRKGGWESSGSC